MILLQNCVIVYQVFGQLQIDYFFCYSWSMGKKTKNVSFKIHSFVSWTTLIFVKQKWLVNGSNKWRHVFSMINKSR